VRSMEEQHTSEERQMAKLSPVAGGRRSRDPVWRPWGLDMRKESPNGMVK
jgi:hypothetical protein